MKFRIFKWLLVCSVIASIVISGKVQAVESSWKPTVEEVRAKLEGIRYSTAAKTTGELKTLAFLVSFPEYTEYTYVDPVIAEEIMFGTDNYEKPYLRGIRFPYESLTSYYNRASYGKLNITGDVYGWYQAKYPLETYSHWSLVDEILSFYDDQIDYSNYDGDNDGVIDALVLSFALSPEVTAEARSFVFQTNDYSGPEYQFDGMIVKRVAAMMNGSHLNIDISRTYLQVLIHEFGHILGAFDTYDRYDEVFSRSGGSYSYEMMNNAEWDISSFQKLVFGWIDNINIVGPHEENRIEQSSFDLLGETTIIFPFSDNLDEFILVEYLTFQANMQRAPSVLYEPGLRLWRVNLSESNYNNDRDGSLKVIESMLMGGLVHSNVKDYEFVANVVSPGEEITPYTNPSSFLYAYDSQNRIIGKPSNVSITNLEYLPDSEIAFNVTVNPNLVPVELNFDPIKLSGNYIDLVGNTEYFLNNQTVQPYLTNGVDVYFFEYRFDAPTSQETDRSKHQLILTENKDYPILNEDDIYYLVVPAGMFKTFSGSINKEIIVPIYKTYFPLIDYQIDNPIQNNYYHVDYYIQNDNVIHVSIGDNIDDSKDIILKRIGINGEISQFKLGLTIPRSSLVSSTQLENQEIIIHYYDSDTKEINVVKTNLQHQITHSYSLYSERYGNFVYSFRNVVLVKTLFQEEFDAGTNLFWKIDFQNPISQIAINLPGFRVYERLFVGNPKSTIFRLNDELSITVDQNWTQSFALIDNEMNLITSNESTHLTGISEFSIGFAIIDGERIGRLVVKSIPLSLWYGDIHLEIYDYNLNLLESEKVIEKIHYNDYYNFFQVLTKLQDGYAFTYNINPTPYLSANEPYSKTVFLNRNLEMLGTFTERKPKFGVVNKALPFHDRIFIGSMLGYKISKPYSINEPKDIFPPIVVGVKDGSYYNYDLTITFNEGTATLNGLDFFTGSIVSQEGIYTLVVTDLAGNITTVNFVIDKVAPIITVTPYSDEPTHLPVTVSVSTDEGTLNAESHTYNENDSFTFIATDLAGNVTEETVTITHIVSPTHVKTISISQLPTKLNYIQGVELDPTGGQISVITFEGSLSTLPLTFDMLSGYEPYSSVFEPQTVTVNYQGVTTSFEVYLNRFIDIPYGHRNYTHINALVGLGIINGYSDNTFRPNNTLTRAQAAIMIVRAAGISTEGVISNFTDVPSTHAAYKFISAAYQAGIINGYSDGTFRPNANVTRAQIAIMVQRAFNVQASGIEVSFTDVPEGYAPRKFIEILASQKIVNGYSDGTFKPLNNVTRAQFSTMIYNAIQYAQKGE